MQIIKQQTIPNKIKWLKDCELVAIQVAKLEPVKNGVGDCLQVHFNPEDARQYTNSKLTIRQVEPNLWRVWRRS